MQQLLDVPDPLLVQVFRELALQLLIQRFAAGVVQADNQADAGYQEVVGIGDGADVADGFYLVAVLVGIFVGLRRFSF